jgi:lipopolysaccharide/colanic/teichoic acid biosynthesis glycosyltransferase
MAEEVGTTTAAEGAARHRDYEADKTKTVLEHATANPVAQLGDDREIGDRPSLSDLMMAPPRPVLYEQLKRLIDISVGGSLLLISMPLMAVVWLAIKIDSRGPALFRQERIGRHGTSFTLVKFRTMHADASTRFPELYRYEYRPDELDEFFFKFPHDPRCTRVGRWIRRTSLDELPNLFNVVKGDISLVGPRPEIFPMLPFYRPHQLCKFGVKPGMTGLAQVSGRNILRWQETNQRDVEYVHRRSLRLDMSILLRTVSAVVGMVGAL